MTQLPEVPHGSSGRTFALGAAALGLGALVAEGVLLAPRRLRVSHHTLGEPGSPGEPGEGSERIRLAVLTDLHLGRLRGFHEELATAVEEACTDVLLFVGDSVDDAGALHVLGEFLDLLPPGPLRFATLGNWEYWGGVDLGELRRTYEAGDTALLVNEGVRLSPGAALYAVDDPLAGRPDLGALPPPSERPDTLLLSHCPGYRDRLTGESTRGIRAVISGHTHGGQVALGRWAPLLPPGSGGYVSGWYRGGDAPDLFVSRGLGTSMVPVRIGALPELAIVDWYPERAWG